jgi:hypothetical protein
LHARCSALRDPVRIALAQPEDAKSCLAHLRKIVRAITSRLAVRVCGLLGLLSCALCASRASELDLTGGDEITPDTGHTYTWGIEYRRPLREHLSASFY